MKDKKLEQQIQHSLNAELSGLNTTSWQRDQFFENATGGYKVKRKLSYGLVLAIVLLLAAATAVAVALLSPKEVVEQVAVPMAQENDPDWRVNMEFSAEELETFIRKANEIGIEIDDSHPLMEALRNGDGYDEEEAIMEVCRQAFGGTYSTWTLEERHWFDDMLTEIGFTDGESQPLPGPDDLTEEEARAKMIEAIQAEFNDEMYLHDYGEEMNLADREKFALALDYYPEAKTDGTVWHLEAWPRGEERYDFYTAALDKAGNLLGVVSMTRKESDALEGFLKPSREAEEMMHIAAEGIREKLKKDIPLEDPEKFECLGHALPGTDDVTWDIVFISKTMDWGYCNAQVSEKTGKVKIIRADAGDITADNILDRNRAVYGWYDEWPSEVWAAVAVAAPNLTAETMTGRIVKATPWIAWHEGLLTLEEAEEQAFRRTGVRVGEYNSACLIDSQPNPVWKFRLIEYFGEYRDMVVEIDAVTGEITDLDMYKADHYTLEPPYHMITLHRIWAKLELEENGPLYLARLAVIHKFADLSYDCPEEDSIPIFKETFWTPEIDGNSVTFRCHWSNLPDYRVTLDENGMPTEVAELASSGTEELPAEQMPGYEE